MSGKSDKMKSLDIYAKENINNLTTASWKRANEIPNKIQETSKLYT